jgi:predicted negative regulator of RcsB-dependent stress response
LLYAQTYRLAGDDATARDQFESAKGKIERQLATETDPAVTARLDVARAEAQVALGQADVAERSLMHASNVETGAAESSEIRLAAIVGVLVPLGEYDRAFKELDAYLSTPGPWAIEGLSRDPRLAPIRGDPRFAGLLAKYGRE